MKKLNNKAKAIYLAWGLINFALLFSPKENGKILEWGGAVFYPFTKGDYKTNWDANAYDLTEFVFYMIAPILIYDVITLFKTKDEADK
jgi:phage pi2 protein 07